MAKQPSNSAIYLHPMGSGVVVCMPQKRALAVPEQICRANVVEFIMGFICE